MELRSLLHHEFRLYYRFAFVRNPWDRMVSIYSRMDPHMRLRAEEAGRTFSGSSFEEFLDRSEGFGHAHLSPQLRGLHYQVPPVAQGKLVRVTRGAIFDVAVDIRRGSPTFGRHADAVLSADNWHQLWVPVGFVHGYCTLDDDTEVQYKVTDFYSSSHERGIAWNDPELMIAWPFSVSTATLAERDRKWPRLAEQPDLFEYGA